jgi:hypothetical protein
MIDYQVYDERPEDRTLVVADDRSPHFAPSAALRQNWLVPRVAAALVH